MEFWEWHLKIRTLKATEAGMTMSPACRPTLAMAWFEPPLKINYFLTQTQNSIYVLIINYFNHTS